MSKFQTMGKEELRQACREAGISYGKLNNDGMRAALEANDAEFKRAVAGQAKPAHAAPVVDHSAGNKLISEAIAKDPKLAQTTEAKPRPKQDGNKWRPIPKQDGTGLKIEKDREERNGIKRPSIGGTCREIWDALDSLNAAGTMPTAKQVKELAGEKGWNANNANIEYYQWRKFHGIRGRQA